MAKERRKASTTETVVGVAILVALVGIAAVMGVLQSDYDSGLYRGEQTLSAPGGAGAAPSAGRDLFAFALPEGLEAVETARFDAGNLYKKINGQAGLYRSAGFVELRFQRYAVGLEAYVYEMETVDGAYAVWSGQKREGARKVDGLTDNNYETDNALFFALDRYYVELSAAAAGGEAAPARIAFAKAFVANTRASGAAVEEPVFPRDGLVDGAVKLALDSAFGFARFDNVWQAAYAWNEQSATAFLSRRGSPDEAGELGIAFRDFLVKYGAKQIDTAAWPAGALVVELDGAWSLVWIRSSLLLGVYEASNEASARTMAGRMEESFGGGRP